MGWYFSLTPRAPAAATPPFGPQVGVVDIDPEEVVRKGRLMPGNILLVDFDEHRLVEDKELKERYATKRCGSGRARAPCRPILMLLDTLPRVAWSFGLVLLAICPHPLCAFSPVSQAVFALAGRALSDGAAADRQRAAREARAAAAQRRAPRVGAAVRRRRRLQRQRQR